jgi:hypothetical protein
MAENAFAWKQRSTFGRVDMIDENFDRRTLANMEVALDRVCAKTPGGETHEVRKRVADAILRCARSGKRTLGALTEAGERVRIARRPVKMAKSA